MINDKELRIGNTILCKGNEIEIDSIDLSGVNSYHDEGIGGTNYEDDDNGRFEDCEPIPLTEGWLIKLGFDKFPHSTLWDTDKFWAGRFENGVLKISYLEIGVKYVHQLQNLYFALTGEELTIKETT